MPIVLTFENFQQGFSPWVNPSMLWHNGLGGSVGLANTKFHYTISILKNAHEPGVLGAHDGIVSLPDDVLDLIAIVESSISSSSGHCNDGQQCGRSIDL